MPFPSAIRRPATSTRSKWGQVGKGRRIATSGASRTRRGSTNVAARRGIRTSFRLEGEEHRRRTVIATTSPRAGAKVPNTRCILDPATVYRAELSCSLAWLRSIRPWWGLDERRCAVPGFVHADRTREYLDREYGDPEVVNHARITNKPVRTVRAAASRSSSFVTCPCRDLRAVSTFLLSDRSPDPASPPSRSIRPREIAIRSSSVSRV